MGARDPRVDAYLARSAAFARPILERLREAVHAGCPQVVESVKWGRPAFEHHGLLCGMAAFKAHCTFGFWKHDAVMQGGLKQTLSSLGRLTSVDDLPRTPDLVRMVKLAAKLNEEGVKGGPARRSTPRAPIALPPELKAALARDAAARATYDALSPSKKRDYHEWIAEAKRDETRARRLAQAIEWLRAGKSRNWKYERR